MYFRNKPILPLAFLVFCIATLFTYALLQQTAAESAIAASTDRGRVRIVNNNVVADNGKPLRGEHLVFGTEENDTDTDSTILYNEPFWREMRDDYHLNTVRLMMSRPPQNWTPDIGTDCQPPAYRCYPLDYVHTGAQELDGKTTLQIMDDLVDIAGRLGMYIIIDYHPVFGFDSADAAAWWSEVAPRYADRTHVIYELANEPYPNTEYPGNVIDFQEDLYQQIRGDAPDTHIILWSFPVTDFRMAGTVAQADQVSYQNASVGYHPYGGYDASDLTGLRAQYPIIATEIGQNRVDMTNAAESIDVSWIWLDGVAQKPGLESSVDNYQPNDVTWPSDPNAVDQGGTTPPTPTPTNTPNVPPPQPTPTPIPGTGCGPLYQEAEQGILSGKWVIDNDIYASSRAYITIPNTNQSSAANRVTAADVNSNRARYCFTVTTPGLYRIVGSVYADDTRSNSFYVTVDGRPTSGYVWHFPATQSYMPEYVTDNRETDPVEVYLNAGQHLVKIFSRESGARLDWLKLQPADGPPHTPTPAPTSTPVPTATNTPINTPTPPPTNCGALSQEAENGTVWGTMAVREDLNASFGEYVSSTGNTAGTLDRQNRVDYCVTVVEAGEYRIGARVFAPSHSGNSFFVQVNGQPAEGILWDIFPVNGTYTNSYVRQRGESGYASFYLNAGNHTISFNKREPNTRLDSLTVEHVSVQGAATHSESKLEIEQNLAAEAEVNRWQTTKIYLPWIIE